MKGFFYNWVLWKHIVFSFAILALIKIVSTSINQSSSIGVIGAADGPTVIILTGKIYPYIISYVVLIVMLALYIPVKNILKRI